MAARRDLRREPAGVSGASDNLSAIASVDLPADAAENLASDGGRLMIFAYKSARL
jgi:hypothetical protein